jgi:hypothetical protein
MRLRLCILGLALASVSVRSNPESQQPSPTPAAQASPAEAQEIPVMDGGVGPCSVTLTVTDGLGKGVYGATIKVHMAYGFAGIRKLDLEAGTDSKGKVVFKGLPAKVHNPPLEFHATKNDLTGLATYNPETECQAKHDIVLEKVKEPAAN